MKKICLVLLLVQGTYASAQKGLDEMIAAEKSFAAYSVAHNAQEAFMKFIDTGAVVFDQGNFVNGYQLWKVKKPFAGILDWRPRFAEIAASGDFGYTCGPWTFQPKTVTDSVTGNGYFFTVWQKRKGGDWKFIFDTGTDEGPLLANTAVLKVESKTTKGTLDGLLKTEAEFSNLSKNNPRLLLSNFVTTNTILCSEGSGLTNSSFPSGAYTHIMSNANEYVAQGNGIAQSGDLGYVYGIASYSYDHPASKSKKYPYLRIWRHGKEGWKLALQLLRLPLPPPDRR